MTAVVVTNGALHAIALDFAASIDPGHTVVLDDPVFPDHPAVCNAVGRARLVELAER